MNKTELRRWVKRAARASRLELDNYESIMGEAAMLCDSDEQWEWFVHEVELAEGVPLTPREQKIVENRKLREALENARLLAVNSQRDYQRLLKDAHSH